MHHGRRLRDAIAHPGTTPLIGVYDMYSASLAARHYDGLFVSGFGFAAWLSRLLLAASSGCGLFSTLFTLKAGGGRFSNVTRAVDWNPVR